MLEVTKISNGVFQVSLNGVETNHTIINSSAGMSGRGKNEYIIVTRTSSDTRHTYAGSLQRAKKLVAHWLGKENNG